MTIRRGHTAAHFHAMTGMYAESAIRPLRPIWKKHPGEVLILLTIC